MSAKRAIPMIFFVISALKIRTIGFPLFGGKLVSSPSYAHDAYS